MANPEPISERRKAPRYLFRADVEIEWGSRILRVPISDISLSGVFISTGELLSVGSEFSARILVDRPLEVDCVVRRVVPGRGIGVEFLSLADSSRARLESLLRALAEE